MGPNALPFEINCKHDIYLYNTYLHGVYMYVHLAQSVKKYASKPRIADSNLAPILHYFEKNRLNAVSFFQIVNIARYHIPHEVK